MFALSKARRSVFARQVTSSQTKGSSAASAAISLGTSIKNCPPNRPAWLVRQTPNNSSVFSPQRPKNRAVARKVTFPRNQLCWVRWIATSRRAGYFNREGRSGEVRCSSARWLPQRAVCICASSASSASVPTPRIYPVDVGRSIVDASFAGVREVYYAPLSLRLEVSASVLRLFVSLLGCAGPMGSICDGQLASPRERTLRMRSFAPPAAANKLCAAMSRAFERIVEREWCYSQAPIYT